MIQFNEPTCVKEDWRVSLNTLKASNVRPVTGKLGLRPKLVPQRGCLTRLSQAIAVACGGDEASSRVLLVARVFIHGAQRSSQIIQLTYVLPFPVHLVSRYFTITGISTAFVDVGVALSDLTRTKLAIVASCIDEDDDEGSKSNEDG